MFDFGYVALDILYAFPEDSGIYTLIARNELGEVQSNLELIVNSEKSLYLDAHHPEGNLNFHYFFFFFAKENVLNYS